MVKASKKKDLAANTRWLGEKPKEIATLEPLSIAIRNFRNNNAQNTSDILLIYDYGQTGTFYYILSKDFVTASEYKRIIKLHHTYINIDDEPDAMWLHDHLMPKRYIYKDHEQKHAEHNGKWFHMRLSATDVPFSIEGKFTVVVTGFAD